MAHFKIVRDDGTVDPDMSKEIPSQVRDLSSAVDGFLKKRNLFREFPTSNETEASFHNPDTGEVVHLRPDAGDF